MARVRPTEIKAVVKLLDEPHEDVEELAAQIISTIDEVRAKRRDAVIVVAYHDQLYVAVGPYATPTEAGRALKGGFPPYGSRYRIVPLRSQRYVDNTIAAAEAPPNRTSKTDTERLAKTLGISAKEVERRLAETRRVQAEVQEWAQAHAAEGRVRRIDAAYAAFDRSGPSCATRELDQGAKGFPAALCMECGRATIRRDIKGEARCSGALPDKREEN